MFLVLPVISGIFLFLIFHNQGGSWRSAVLSAALVWGVLVTGITEVLSLNSSVSFVGVCSLWLVTDFILGLIFIRSAKKAKNIPTSFNSRFIVQPFYIFLLVCVAFIALAIGCIALIAPPNNWDSMSYHMPRVAHWIQNHSIAYYPTSYTPQLYQPPWAEFAVLHFQLLSGSDRFANLVQWFSMVGSLIGVSLIAKQLGGDFRGQVLSVVVCATIPMGILQASNTKNDYVLSFWLVCLVYYVLLTSNVRINWIHVLRLGVSLGLASFTKGTAYIYVLPFLFWFILAGSKQIHGKILKSVLLILAIAAVINLGYYSRNFDLFGSPISTFPQKYTNDVFSLTAFISNVSKNAALHMAVPLDLVNNDVILSAIYQLHAILGVRINDPRTTWPGTEFSLPAVPTFEDTAGNPIHFGLLLFTIVLSIASRKLRKNHYYFTYLLAILSSFLLFCFLLKWQPWHSRLHLPIFVLFSPFIGGSLSRLSKQRIARYMMIILIQTSLVFVLYNENKPIIAVNNILNTSRGEQYFSIRSNIKKDYNNAASFVRQNQCNNIGLYLRPDAWEYPLWVLLNKTAFPRIEHINVKNLSAKKSSVYPFSNFIPCTIISVGPVESEEINTKGGVYVRAWQSSESPDPVQVFVKQ